MLTWTILLFAVFTGLCAFAQGYWDLLVYRTIAGLGPRRRVRHRHGAGGRGLAGRSSARGPAPMSALGWQAGVLRAALVTPLLLPAIGWRGMFIVGLIPGVVAFAVRWYVGEPKIFTRAARRKPAHAWRRCGCW